MKPMIRRLHRIAGLLLVLPMLGWIATAFVFYFKPGYNEAYAQLAVKTYPLESGSVVPEVGSDWEQYRVVRTVLGDHLLVKIQGKWGQLDLVSREPRDEPSEKEVRRLLEDAIQVDRGRYGSIETLEGLVADTSTGVKITLNWPQLTLWQYGRDTARIDMLYRIHYLQWTRIGWLDRILGCVGLGLLLLLTGLGVGLLRNSRPLT